jgi:hypothetical protein
MPITIDGTGTISGISAGGLPDSSITNADLATDAVSTSKILNGAVTTAKLGSAEQSGLCKAWVNFNGTSTVAIRASYNVSSITDNATGDYTVNFTTALVDANYVTTGSCQRESGAPEGILTIYSVNSSGALVSPTTIAARINTSKRDGGPIDSAFVNVAIFR